MSKITAASATEVREFFVSNPKKVPTGDKTVGKAPGEHRGLLSKGARDVFEAETGKRYVSGTTSKVVEMTYSYTQPSGRSAKRTETLPLKEIRTLAAAPERGRLTEAHYEAAREALSKRATEASIAAKAAKAKTAEPAEPDEDATAAE
jgi:hypothetical protein